VRHARGRRPNTGVAAYAPVSNVSSALHVFGAASIAAAIVGGIYAVNGGAVSYGSNLYANLAWLYAVGASYDGPPGLGTSNGMRAF
jgi:hypothetical protein